MAGQGSGRAGVLPWARGLLAGADRPCLRGLINVGGRARRCSLGVRWNCLHPALGVLPCGSSSEALDFAAVPPAQPTATHHYHPHWALLAVRAGVLPVRQRGPQGRPDLPNNLTTHRPSQVAQFEAVFSKCNDNGGLSSIPAKQLIPTLHFPGSLRRCSPSTTRAARAA